MKLNYRKFGQGHPLIIVHGLYGSSDNWITIGKALAENFEVYIVDQRNHGSSPHAEEHTYRAMMEDLKIFMDDHQLNKAILLGHSMGGKTVMFFAAEHPERVTSLVVIDIAPKNYSTVSDYAPKTIDHVNIVNTMLNFDFSGFKTRTEIDKKLAENIHSPKVRQFLLKNLKRKEDKSFGWKLNTSAIHSHLPEIMDGMNGEDFSMGRGITGFPILFIRGENSNYIREEDHKLIRTIFPYAEITNIPNAGHWVHAEQPNLLVKTVEYFVLD
ncbi:MAG: alpha/beta fold hydrolase [Marinifilaceae bacterium]